MQEPPPRPDPARRVEPAPRAGDVAPYIEDDRPATVADIRSLRNWLLVVAVWAVAATALGVIALIEANQDDDGKGTVSAGELARIQRALNARIDRLESRLAELPTSDDVSKLDGRLKAVENGADKAVANTDRLRGRIDDLEGRVDDLTGRVDDLEGRVDRIEQAQQSQQSTEAAP
jgi:TolA-binding protein